MKSCLWLRMGLLALLGCATCSTRLAAVTWQTYNASFEGGTIKIVHPAALQSERTRIEWLVEMADRSTVTDNPLNVNTDGLLGKNDVVVCTNDLLLWFDCTSPGNVTTNGGGGLIRGLWTLQRDGGNNLNFKRIVNGYNYSPNTFFPGSRPGLQGSGISLLGSYGSSNVDNGITFAIEHEVYPTITASTGVTIPTGETHGGGVFVQFQGQLANSPLSQSELTARGLADHYDSSNDGAVLGRTQYTLTYRIPDTGVAFRQEIALSVTSNAFGASASLVLSHCMAGHDAESVKFVSTPALNGSILQADGTAYFTLSGYALNFYTLPWSAHAGSVQWAETTLGAGQLLGTGMPHITYPRPFFEFRPAVGSLPSYAQSRFALQAIDNQVADTSGRTVAMDLQLWDVNRGHAAQSFAQGTVLNLIADYALH